MGCPQPPAPPPTNRAGHHVIALGRNPRQPLRQLCLRRHVDSPRPEVSKIALLTQRGFGRGDTTIASTGEARPPDPAEIRTAGNRANVTSWPRIEDRRKTTGDGRSCRSDSPKGPTDGFRPTLLEGEASDGTVRTAYHLPLFRLADHFH